MAAKKYVFKYVIGKLEKALVFQILEQQVPEKALSDTVGTMSFRISAHPEIRTQQNRIYLRGSNVEANERVDVDYFDTNEQRDSVHDLLIAAFAKWGEDHGITVS